MDGISYTAGIGGTLTLGGRKLTVRAKFLQHYAEIEAKILDSRGNIFDIIRQMAAAVPPGNMEAATAMAREGFLEARNARIVTLAEIWDWMDNTVEGRCFRTWLSVRENDPETLTLEWVSQAYLEEYERIAMEEGTRAAEIWDTAIYRKIQKAEGDDELGNSNSSPSEGTGAEADTPSPGT